MMLHVNVPPSQFHPSAVGAGSTTTRRNSQSVLGNISSSRCWWLRSRTPSRISSVMQVTWFFLWMTTVVLWCPSLPCASAATVAISSSSITSRPGEKQEEIMNCCISRHMDTTAANNGDDAEDDNSNGEQKYPHQQEEQEQQKNESTLLFYNKPGYSDIYNKTMQDSRLGVDTLFTSRAGIGIMSTTATISTISSIVIIYIISKSSVGFGSVYHRIVFGMSAADILQSFAMAFTTLPMPRNLIYEQFEGLIMGNDTTCSIQGFIYMCGFIAGTFYNIFLTYYYLCAITFNMTDTTFRKYYEPILHIFTVGFALIVAILCWDFDLIHPSPLYPFCVTTAYPYWCNTEEDCLRGDIWKPRVVVLWFVSALTVGLTGVLGIVFLVIVICSVYIREKRMKENVTEDEEMKQDYYDNEENEIARQLAWNDFTYTKSVMKQSMYYVMAYIAVYIFPLIRSASNVTGEMLPSTIQNTWFQLAYVLLRPSQGTLNLVIFLYHKIWKMQKQNPTLSFIEALKSILWQGDKAEDKAISSVEIVRRDNVRANLNLGHGHPNSIPEEEDEDDSTFEDSPRISFGEYSVSDRNSKLEPATSSSQNSAIEVPSTGRITNSSLGFSWMGVSLSGNDGSVQFSSQPSLRSHNTFAPDDNSSCYVSKGENRLE